MIFALVSKFYVYLLCLHACLAMCLFKSVLNVKALIGTFNQEKALVGTFSVIVIFANLRLKLHLRDQVHGARQGLG